MNNEIWQTTDLLSAAAVALVTAAPYTIEKTHDRKKTLAVIQFSNQEVLGVVEKLKAGDLLVEILSFSAIYLQMKKDALDMIREVRK